MAVVWACFALPILCLFNLSLMTYITAVHTLWTPLYFKHLCIIQTSLHRIDTSPYCGHLSIMNAICILWTPLHAYYGHLSIMNAICILWTLLHTVDTPPLWMQYAYYGHLATINAICILSTPLHTVDTSPLWMQYAYYGHLSILWIPLHYEHNMHTIDTSAFFRHILWTPLHTSHYYTHLCINYGHPCIPRKPMHNMDPSASTDTSAYYSLHLCIHVPWTPMHNIDTSTYSRQLLPIVLLVHTTDTWVILVSVY